MGRVPRRIVYGIAYLGGYSVVITLIVEIHFNFRRTNTIGFSPQIMERKANRYYVYSDERQENIKEIKKDKRIDRTMIWGIIGLYTLAGIVILLSVLGIVK